MYDDFGRALTAAAEEYGKFTGGEQNGNYVMEGELEAGTKGMTVRIEFNGRTLKIKGSREYKYPIDEKAADAYQEEILGRLPEYQCYLTGQTLSFSKFSMCASPDDAAKMLRRTFDAVSEAVSLFERNCVRFQGVMEDEHEQQDDDYNPEESVSYINVDNTLRSVSVTEADNEEYSGRNRSFAEKTFAELCESLNGRRNGNEFTAEADGKHIHMFYFPQEAEIRIAVSVNVSKDVGTMYESYIRSSFPDVKPGYDDREKAFVLKKYSAPDEYAPDETKEYLDLCLKAMDACVAEYSQILEKKDSARFASDVQEVLMKQTETVSEREKKVSAREEETAAREEEVAKRTEELEERAKQLDEERAAMLKEIEEERVRIQEHEAQMADEIKEYEDRNTKDILRIQQLADQVAALQNRQSALGQDDSDMEEEVFRLKSRVQQLITQKAALEKKLNEKISARDGKIRELGDQIAQKDAEINKLETGIEDMAKSKAAEETQKTREELEDLKNQIAAVGHVLTANEVLDHFKQYDGLNVRKVHAQDGEFITYDDASLEIRIRIGDMNYVDVSKKASVKDSNLKKLNSAHTDIKFFSSKDRTVARSYFPINASADDAEQLADEISEFFTK